jgi:exopolyphosphatase/guanosine-5'-triphosphate,3'-diphosphate pyrophosphatase
VKVGVVDIGTNSMRLLITDGDIEDNRWVEVTGLGRGVDKTGLLSDAGIEDTLAALARFGVEMDRSAVAKRMAIATSASRDAANREEFFDLAESALGVRPRLISGEEEARLAYAGATGRIRVPGPIVVTDIGGGSTELVTSEGGISYEIGSVRLTERAIPTRPAPADELTAARSLAAEIFEGVDLDMGTLIGVAGTWTSLAAVARAGVWGSPARSHSLPANSRERVHGYVLVREDLTALIESLAGMTLDETAAIPSLDPKRAPVILGGALVAEAVMAALHADRVTISEHDTLDGVAIELLALR